MDCCSCWKASEGGDGRWYPKTILGRTICTTSRRNRILHQHQFSERGTLYLFILEQRALSQNKYALLVRVQKPGIKPRMRHLYFAMQKSHAREWELQFNICMVGVTAFLWPSVQRYILVQLVPADERRLRNTMQMAHNICPESWETPSS